MNGNGNGISSATHHASSLSVGGAILPASSSASSLISAADTASGRCVELALEGERRCRSGDTKSGIVYLEDALAAGTDDLRTLSAIYSQLGNAYFYMGDYIKALEYHRHDLTLARTINDKPGEAKASGNLGNTLKVLGKFDEAILCCLRHLEISRDLGDKIGESRALYNVGNVYHAKGKHIGRMSHSEAGEFPSEVRACLQKAVEYYEQNLNIVKKLGDRSAEGRACGNLGNTYYLLGDFRNAVRYHMDRLEIAKEFGDKPAMRRAYSNLGNAHVFLGEFDQAIDYYKQALAIAVELRDQATEAQACYSLGNTCTLIGEHQQAIAYHLRHLKIARLLKDRVGQARACWSLGNAFTSLGDHSKALYFVAVHLQLSREIGDQTGEMVAEQNWSDLVQILGPSPSPDSSADPEPVDFAEPDIGIRRMRRMPIDRMSNSRSDEYGASSSSSLNGVDTASKKSKDLIRTGAASSSTVATQFRSKIGAITSAEDVWDDESFFELLSRAQSKRMDDQRCDPRALLENKENRPRVRATDGARVSPSAGSVNSTRTSLSGVSVGRRRFLHRMFYRTAERFSLKRVTGSGSVFRFRQKSNSTFSVENCSIASSTSKGFVISAGIAPSDQGPEEFLDMVAGIQGRRMDDQRAALPWLPGLQHPAILLPHLQRKQKDNNAANGDIDDERNGTVGQKQLDDDFIEMLIRCQSTRIEEQRSELPLKKAQNSVTMPDDDFFQMLVKMQARRFDEQRAELEPTAEAAADEPEKPEEADEEKIVSPENPPHKRTSSQKIKKR